ncbi:hypothetical protein [Anaerococcus sp. Marseille-P3625]|uniref:hypothetical protein n=1 Tax=Anaerococcus sp. Marseille-P3625 TaxID=1977277 RepID=UPI000C07AA0E|nr:hypothetical protein [Anaerococcus sp. Marseille-P3625]
MKKYISILILSLIMVGCTNSSNQKDYSNNEISSKTANDEIDLSKKEEHAENIKENEENDENKIKSFENEKKDKDTKEDSSEDKKVEIDVKKSDDDDKEDKYKKVKDEDNKDKKSKEEKNEKESSKVSKNDYFYLPASALVRLNEDGEMVDVEGNTKPEERNKFYDYVKYTNNILVESNISSPKAKIIKVTGKEKTTLFEFPKGEDFRPLGMIGDKIYGFHTYTSYNEEQGIDEMDSDKSAIGVVDLAKGKVFDYQATVGIATGTIALIQGEIQYTSNTDKDSEDIYNYDLYKLDLNKGYDQKAELIEKDFGLQYLFGQKNFENGKASWHIRRADNDNIYVDGKKFPFLWAEMGSQEFIGNNIFYFTGVDAKGDGPLDHFLSHLKIIDIDSQKEIFNQDIRGLKLFDGKLYYLNKDKEVKSLDLDL